MTEPKVKLTHSYTILAEVLRVEHFPKSGGWFVHFLGSWESLCFGGEKPFEVGDKVKITFTKQEPTCLPYPSTNPTNTPNS